MNLLGNKFVKGYYKAIEPLGNWLAKAGIQPNTITWTGLIFTFVVFYYFIYGSFLWGGVFLVIAGTCDVLDGYVARKNSKINKFGAFFDSTIDRYSDILVFLGMAIYFDQTYINILIIMAVAGALLTSYTRARAEALGIECKVGLMQRPQRVTYIAVAAILDGLIGRIFIIDHLPIIFVIGFVAIFSNITVLQRVMHVKKELQI